MTRHLRISAICKLWLLGPIIEFIPYFSNFPQTINFKTFEFLQYLTFKRSTNFLSLEFFLACKYALFLLRFLRIFYDQEISPFIYKPWQSSFVIDYSTTLSITSSSSMAYSSSKLLHFEFQSCFICLGVELFWSFSFTDVVGSNLLVFATPVDWVPLTPWYGRCWGW